MTSGTVAAIDCGTNSIRLLIASPGPGDDLVEVARELTIVRLGQGIDATGEFHPDALRRTFTAVDRYADQIAAAGAERIRFVATSAARDAGNRAAFFAGVEQRLGVRPEVISGDEEAALSFAGAVRGVPGTDEPILVMDIGGGSTELIAGGSRGIVAGRSLDIGSVRITERCWPSEGSDDPDPPTAQQVAVATAQIDGLLDDCGLAFDTVHSWIGVAGTVTSMAAIAQQLPHYDRSRVHGFRLDLDTVRALALRLRTTPVAQLRTLGCLDPRRADVIAAGALIADRVSRRLGVAELVVSESDILDGIARALFDAP